MYDGVSLGQWLKQQRKARDLTQAELARMVGCAAITIRKIEAGVLRPSRQVAERMADTAEVASAERAAAALQRLSRRREQAAAHSSRSTAIWVRLNVP